MKNLTLGTEKQSLGFYWDTALIAYGIHMKILSNFLVQLYQ